MHKKIEYDYQCTACKGTGIYVGFAEDDGFGVVCQICNGTGKAHVKLEYDDFIEKVKRKDIKRVLQCNPGIAVGIGKNLTLNSFGGMDYEDWFNGKPFPDKSEMREFTCPAWWFQSADYKKKPDWARCDNLWGKAFSACCHFNNKEECWRMFDKEQKLGAKKK